MGMVIAIMFFGMAVGFLFRKVAWLRKTDILISGTVILLLFLLGFSMGANETIIRNLGTLGLQALLIASAGIMGSVFAAWGVYTLFFKKKNEE